MTRTRLMLIALLIAALGAMSCASQEPMVEDREDVIGDGEIIDEPGEPEGRADLSVIGIVLNPEVRETCGLDEPHAFFEFDSAQLTANAKTNMAHLAECMNTGALAGKELQIVGHTDPRGSDAYNEELGMSRAESVADYLMRQGVPADRLNIVSMGELRADADPVDWPTDRRVDIRIAL